MSFHLSECANFSVTFSSKTLHLPFVISGMRSFVDFQRRYVTNFIVKKMQQIQCSITGCAKKNLHWPVISYTRCTIFLTKATTVQEEYSKTHFFEIFLKAG